MKIYIAGLIADGGRLQPHQIADNCQAFDNAEMRLISRGWEAVNPIKLHDPHPTELPQITLEVSQLRLRKDVQELATCDAIFMLLGWERSQGAFLEFYIARALGLGLHLDRDDGYYPAPPGVSRSFVG